MKSYIVLSNTNLCREAKVEPLEDRIKQSILDFVDSALSGSVPNISYYGNVNYTDPSCITFMPDIKHYIKKYGMPRPVGVAPLPPNISSLMHEWSCAHNFQNKRWFVQFIKRGSFVAPHIDDTSLRTKNTLYIISAGGSDIKTTWWDMRPDMDYNIPFNTAIPFDCLIKKYSAILEEDKMYDIDVSNIHSVSYVNTNRVAVFAC